MSPPRLSFTREEVFKALGIVVALTLGWGAVEARVGKVEDRQIQQAEANREIRADIKEIRQDVKDVVRSLGRMERKNDSR